MPEPSSCPNEPTVHTLNDALFAQFAGIRSVTVGTCDYGSGGREFESLPARFSIAARYASLAGRYRCFEVFAEAALNAPMGTDSVTIA